MYNPVGFFFSIFTELYIGQPYHISEEFYHPPEKSHTRQSHTQWPIFPAPTTTDLLSVSVDSLALDSYIKVTSQHTVFWCFFYLAYIIKAHPCWMCARHTLFIVEKYSIVWICTFCLSIPQLIDIWASPALWLWYVMLLWTFQYKFCVGICVHFSWLGT